MDYRMIVLDVDGTLLTNDKRISDANKRALKAAVDIGVKVVISTGRIFTSAVLYSEMLGIDTPVIASNGAYIKEKDRDEVIFAKTLGEENAKKIVRLIKSYGMYCHLFSWDTIFTEKIIHSSFNYSKWNKNVQDDKKINIRVIDNLEWDDIIHKYRDSILKAVVTDDDAEKLAALRLDISKLDVEIASAYKNSIEIMNKGVSKGSAIEMLMKYYNISREEVISMGDSENDIPMIKYAGLGIAMGNGTPDVKNASDFVTLSNEEDGVAYAIEKFILNAAL